MRILYLIYGEQSGVIRFLTEEFTKNEIKVDILNLAYSVHPLKEGKISLQSFKKEKIINIFLSKGQFGKNWKKYILRTTYAFDKMSEYADKYLKNNFQKYDLVIQSGCLFGLTKTYKKLPYALYIDQTYQISKRYKSLSGKPEKVIADKKWEEKEKLIYSNATTIFTMSEYAKNSLVKDYSISKNKVIVIGAGPNLKEIPPFIERNYDPGNILFVGIDFERKGGPQLLKAFKKINKTFPKTQLYIVGPNLNIKQKGVIFKGFLDHDSIRNIYSDASIFVLPTLREPFGIAFLEAMAYQLPCLGTKIEAIPEIIDDGITGALVTPGDVDELAEKIISLISFPKILKRMGLNGRNKIINYYNWNTVSNKIIETFF